MTKNSSPITKNIEPLSNNSLVPVEYLKMTGKAGIVQHSLTAALLLAKNNEVLYVTDDAAKSAWFKSHVTYNPCFSSYFSQTLLVRRATQWGSKALYARMWDYLEGKVDYILGLPPISYAQDCAFKIGPTEQSIIDSFLADCRKLYENGGMRGECLTLLCEDRYVSHLASLMHLDDQIDEIWGS